MNAHPQRFDIFYKWILLPYQEKVVLLQYETLTNICKKCEYVIGIWR